MLKLTVNLDSKWDHLADDETVYTQPHGNRRALCGARVYGTRQNAIASSRFLCPKCQRAASRQGSDR